MEMVKIVKNGIDYFCTYQRQGNDKNGNPFYIVSVFKWNEENESIHFDKLNFETERRLDKYGNLKFTSYNILSDINHILQKL
jgi:hypothetical protein